MAKRIIICAGIDTGKHKLDVALEGCPDTLQVGNTADGHVTLSAWLRQHRVERVGIEASGGYEQAVVAHLRRDGFVVVVFQPAQVRAYAKFLLQRAKNDKIDAGLIAACTAATKKIHAPPDPRLAPFAEHLTLIEQIRRRSGVPIIIITAFNKEYADQVRGLNDVVILRKPFDSWDLLDLLETELAASSSH